MRIMILAILGLSLASCATGAPGPTIDQRLSQLVGQPIGSVIQARGMPAQTMDVPGQGKAYLWTRNGPTVFAYGMAMPVHCEITLFTDAENVVRSYHWQGGGCR